MKLSSGPAYDAIRKGFEVQVGVVCHADWNMNKFFGTAVDNTPSEDSAGYDIELFPIESIAMANRPLAGINKAIIGQALVESDNHDTSPSARYYISSKDDLYKYWQSPNTAAATITSGSYAMTNCVPRVEYLDVNGANTTVPCNKIQYTVENSYSGPVNYLVEIQSTVGGGWSTIATNQAVPAGGKVELWYNGSTWTTTPNYAQRTTRIHAVRLTVTSMNVASAYFNLIELAAHLELDVSSDIVNSSDSFSMGDVDYITPVGDLSSNTGSIELMNENDLYTNSNPGSLLYGLLDHGVEFNLWYRYTVAGTPYDIKEFKLYSDVWSEGMESTSVDLIDGSMFFQAVKPRPVMYLNVTVQEAIWKVCDQIGFNNYNVVAMPNTPHTNINVFWTTGDNTAWEIFQDLSKSTQCAIWFDEFGTLQIKTREATFDNTQSTQWTLRQNTSGVELADIISLTPKTDYEANKVTVNWQSTHFAAPVDNITPMTVVWEPDGDYVLRSSTLVSDFNIGDAAVYISSANAASWLWVGKFQIDGEWVSYNGKRYVYIDAGGTRQVATVKSFAEQQRYDAQSPVHKQYLNHYNGALMIDTRGLYNTDPQNHKVNSLVNWTKTLVNNYGTASTPCNGITQDVKNSTVTIQQGNNKQLNDYRYLHRGGTISQGWRRLGTRLQVNKSGHKDKEGGIFFGADGTNVTAGYYIDIVPTARLGPKMRQIRNEVLFYSMKGDGSKKLFGGDRIVIKDKSKGNDKTAHHIRDTGAEILILEDQWIDVDVYYDPATDDHIQIWIDGKLCIDATVTNASGWKHSFIDRFGMFVRGNSSFSYEYMYGVSRSDILYTDQESFYDRIHGGYRGYQWMKDYVYETRQPGHKQKRPQTKQKVKYQQRLFDEFGPYLHEIVEFDVKFNTNGLPVQQSRLYSTNDQRGAIEEYWSDPSSGHFTAVNISRYNAVMNGGDVLPPGSISTPVNQHLLIYGQALIQDGAKQIIKNDTWAQNRRGLIESDYQSTWIQNEAEANNFSDWLINHWSRSDTSADVEIFGNPLIELGDVVAVQYKEMTPAAYRFYVVSINNSFDGGITTTLTLRRAV